MFQKPDVGACCFLPAGVFPSKQTKAVTSEGCHVVINTNMAK
jgi:hypothetical protein